MPRIISSNENLNLLFDLIGVEVLVGLVSAMFQPSLETKNIARIDTFAAIPKAITFPKFEPSLVLSALTEIIRNQMYFFQC